MSKYSLGSSGIYSSRFKSAVAAVFSPSVRRERARRDGFRPDITDEDVRERYYSRDLTIEDVVKYDIWIQRLGVAFAKRTDLESRINNGDLCDEIKYACDDMFAHLVRETGLPRGYIDVVLWRSLQQGLIKL